MAKATTLYDMQRVPEELLISWFTAVLQRMLPAPVDLHEDVQARLEILESYHHLVPPRHHKGEVKDDPVHGDAFVDEDGLDLRFVQELGR